jgi:hypothetical protein
MSRICHDREIAGPCDGPDLEARRPDNRPALSSIEYRVGAYPDFLARMLHGLPREAWEDPETGNPVRPLAALTTRTSDDPTIALGDAFACVLDVLTFYQERIANEGYIRTATERLSIRELARAIDYELRPGVAASASLAFTVEDADDPFRVVEAAAGVQVLSVPAEQGERPQTFETVEPLVARAEWNAIPARTERPQNVAMFWNPADEDDARNGHLYLLDLDNGFDFSDADPADVVSIDPAASPFYLPVTLGLDIDQAIAELVEDAALNPEIVPVVRGLKVDRVELRGLGMALAVSGRILVVGVRKPANGPLFVRALAFRIEAVEERRAYNLTTVQLGRIDETPAPPKPMRLKFALPRLPIGRLTLQPVRFDVQAANSVIGRASWSSSSLSAFVRTQAWSRTQVMQLFRLPRKPPAPEVGKASPGFFVLRQSLGFFGAGAPRQESLPKPDNQRGDDGYDDEWDTDTGPRTIWVTSQGRALVEADAFLEREVPEVTPGGWALFETPQGKIHAFRIAAAASQSRVDFAISGKTTGLRLREPDGGAISTASYPDFTFRTATARVQSEALALGGLPIEEPVEAGGHEVTLDGLYLDLHSGRAVSIAGDRDDAPGVAEDETATLEDVIHVGGYTRLTLANGLEFSYVRTSLRVNANVALATHGETVLEPLGSGDARLANQAFQLKKPPLTFVSAATDTGAASTLDVRVEGVLWAEVASLHDAGPDDEVYAVRIDEDGATRVVFGDGTHGRRLPTGALNVMATYRSGMGLAGEVAAGALTLLKIRPLGVRGVTNPSGARGAADAETLEEARERAPQSVRTLDRVVSLLDHEDFARGFAGVGKAKVTALWRGRRRLVHVTVSPVAEGVFDADYTTLARLRAAMQARRDPTVTLLIAPHAPRYFRLAAKVAHDPRYLPETVETEVRTALLAAFGYDARPLAEPVSAAAVIATIQGVAGVHHVDLNALCIYSDETPDAPATLETVLPARPARLAAAGEPPDIEPAELLLLLESGIDLSLGAADA